MNIQDEVQKIHARYGITEKANYEIQKVSETYARIQIEKDRKLLMNNLYQDQEDKTIWETFKNTPINLD